LDEENFGPISQALNGSNIDKVIDSNLVEFQMVASQGGSGRILIELLADILHILSGLGLGRASTKRRAGGER